MNTKSKIWTTRNSIILLSILLVSLFYTSILIEGWTAVFLLMIAFPIGILLIGFLLFGMLSAIKARDKAFFLPALIGIVTLLKIIYRPVEQLIEKLKSPVILYDYCEQSITKNTLIYPFR